MVDLCDYYSPHYKYAWRTKKQSDLTKNQTMGTSHRMQKCNRNHIHLSTKHEKKSFLAAISKSWVLAHFVSQPLILLRSYSWEIIANLEAINFWKLREKIHLRHQCWYILHWYYTASEVKAAMVTLNYVYFLKQAVVSVVSLYIIWLTWALSNQTLDKWVLVHSTIYSHTKWSKYHSPQPLTRSS